MADGFDQIEHQKLMRARLLEQPLTVARYWWENNPPEFPDPEQPAGQPVPIVIRERYVIIKDWKSSTGFLETIGQTQYDVYVPVGRGTRELNETALQIAKAFKPGQSLTSTDMTIILERADRAGSLGRDEDVPGWVFKTVSCHWRVFTPVSA